MKQQRATFEKRNAPRNKSGDAVGRPSCRSSLLGDPGAKFLVETGHRNRTMKNSLNYVSTCLKIVDTRAQKYQPSQARLQAAIPAADGELNNLPLNLINPSLRTRALNFLLFKDARSTKGFLT